MKKNGKSILLKLVTLAITVCMLFSALSLQLFAIAATEAEEFNAAVNAIDETEGIPARYADLISAEEKLAAYLALENATVEDSDISASFEILVLKRGNLFMAIVDAAYNFYNQYSDYHNTRAYMNMAAEILPGVDRDNIDVSTKIDTYNTLNFTLDEFEQPYESFISYVTAAEEATAYSEKKTAVTEANNILPTLSLDDYPGLEEAKTSLRALKKEVAAIERQADEYIDAVERVKTADDLRSAIAEAEAIYATVDGSVDAVKVARNELLAITMNYNNNVKRANKFVDEMNVFALGLIVGGEPEPPAVNNNGPFLQWIIDTFGG